MLVVICIGSNERTHGFTSLTSPNFFFAASVLTLGGTITSSPGLVIVSTIICARHEQCVTYIQSIGVVTPLLSPVCKLSTTRKTSLVFRPVEAGYIIVNRTFFEGSMTNTLRIVNAIPFSSMLVVSWASTISYR